MGLNNLNKILRKYNLLTPIDPVNLGTHLCIDLNCFLYQSTYNTSNYPEFINKVMYILYAPLKYFTKPQLYIYLDYGRIIIKDKLREQRKEHIKRYLRENDYAPFYDNKIEIIDKVTKDIKRYLNEDGIFNKIIFTNEDEVNMDAEYKMVKDAKDEFWNKDIYPVFYSNDQDIVYLLGRNQKRSSIVIQKSKGHQYWMLRDNILTSKICLLTLMFEGNDYIKGLLGVTSNILITNKLNEDDDLIEYVKKLKKPKILEPHAIEQYKYDINLFNKNIESYSSLSYNFYKNPLNIIVITFVDYVACY